MIHLTVQQLSASLDGALTGPSLELVVRHLAACHDCRDRQARLAKHDDALRRLLAQEPKDIFLDDLTRRAESLVTAISRGLPAPVMVTSVPLLHEEDPYAPAEPPPLPSRPELGRSGEMAKLAGWGRIGMKPTASTHAPPSDPAEAQRMLEALGSGNADDFTELTAQESQEDSRIDGPMFDLPAWIKDQSGRVGPRVEGPREVPRLSLFFEELDAHAAGMTREAVNEVFRRDEAPEAPPFADESLAPEPLAHDLPVNDPVPPEHAAYAPPRWTTDSVTPENVSYVLPEWDSGPARPESVEFAEPGWDAEYPDSEPAEYAQPEPVEYAPPGWGAEYAQPEPVEYAQPGRGAEYAQPVLAVHAPVGWNAEHAQDVDPNEIAWGSPGLEPGSLDPGAYAEPLTGDFGHYPSAAALETAPHTPPTPGVDRAVVLAVASVGALILIVLALQLSPAAARHPAPTNSPSFLGVKVPRVEILPHEKHMPVPVPPKPHMRTAATPPPLEEVMPPLVQPETQAPAIVHERDTSHLSAVEATPTPPEHAPAPAPASVAASAVSSAPSATHAPVRSVRTATPPAHEPATAPASVPATTPATPSAVANDDSDWPLLCGQVEDAAGQPVANARVSMAEISFATRTDARGHFCMSAPAGAHSLFVEASGFTPQREPVSFTTAAPDVHIRLQPAR